MPLSAFLLVVAAAGVHAAWNLAARQARGHPLAVCFGLWIGALAVFPVWLAIHAAAGMEAGMSDRGLLCAVASGLIHALYFGLLSMAYRRGDISLVYPVARGSGIAMIAIAAGIVLEERISLLAAAGVTAVCLGVFFSGKDERRFKREWLLALSVGVATCGYSLVDKTGVALLDPVLYICITWLTAGALFTPAAWWRYRKRFRQTLYECVGSGLVIGVGSIAAYLLILFAMRIAPVSYVSAVREIAVVFGALGGVLYLKEKVTVKRLASIAAIVLGCVLVTLG